MRCAVRKRASNCAEEDFFAQVIIRPRMEPFKNVLSASCAVNRRM